MFTATLHHSQLPFLIHYYPFSFTATLSHSLLSICYPSAFTATIAHSLLPFNIYYYPSSFTATLQHSLLPFIIHYYPSAFTTALSHSLLVFIIYYYPSSFTTIIHHSLLPFMSLYHSVLWNMLVCSQLPIVLRIFAGRIYKPGIQAHPSDFGSITILAKCGNFCMAVYNFSVHSYYTKTRYFQSELTTVRVQKLLS